MIHSPNGLGALLGAIQIFLILVFPRRSSVESNENEEEEEKASSKDNISKCGPAAQHTVDQPVDPDSVNGSVYDC